jgi:hypothetical protein
MRDRALIIAGLVVVLGLATLPAWYNAAFGTPRTEPTLAKPTGERCILPRGEMRRSHMDLLVEWRDRVVRSQEHRFVAPDGKAFEISLTGTCLGCHGAKGEFCDRCHDYAAVKPTCFGCHADREPAPCAAAAEITPGPACGDGSRP